MQEVGNLKDITVFKEMANSALLATKLKTDNFFTMGRTENFLTKTNSIQ